MVLLYDQSFTGLPQDRVLLKDAAAWDSTVRDGLRTDKGMVAFKDEITSADAARIRDYVIHRANEDKTAEAAAAPRSSP